MPQDSIEDWVNNESSMYDDRNSLFDRWLEEGEDWDRREAYKAIRALAAHFAEHIESFDFTEGKYSEREIDEAARDMLREFETNYRDEAIRHRIEQASRKPSPEDAKMDPGDVEHAKKYEELARKLGVEKIVPLIPASRERVRQALTRGDKHLNSIPLRKWDSAALQLHLRERGLSLSEGVCVLKHVAKWHYA